LIFLLLTLPLWSFGQDRLKVEGGHFNIEGGSLVLKDVKLINNISVDFSTASTSKVIVEGTASDANSCVGGPTFTQISNLVINKSMNNATIGGEVEISQNLDLQSGCLDVDDNSLAFEENATLTGTTSTRFIKTSGMGSFSIEIPQGSSFTFGVGRTSFNPVTITNQGDKDRFFVTLLDRVFLNGDVGASITSNVVDRTWLIEKNMPDDSNVDLTMQWNAADETPGFDRSMAYISHFTNGAWDPGPTMGAMGNDPYTITRTGLTSFSPFSVASSPALPVELLAFKGRALEKAVLLEWATATEINNKGFFVERSEDSKAWKSLGFVEGQGNSLEQHDYDFLDEQPISGVPYYRLKQMDFDESFEYSKVIAIEFGDDKVTLSDPFPNPTNDYTQLNLTLPKAEEVTIDIYDVTGQHLQRAVKTFPAGSSNIVLATDHLAAGTYYVQVLLHQKVLERVLVVER
ncbi:MAG: T9SS type A sorting domain-containing protein, partial [Bacteroidota bacterium]